MGSPSNLKPSLAMTAQKTGKLLRIAILTTVLKMWLIESL